MKKSMLLSVLTVLSVILVINANATIRRVGYFGTYVSGTDYGSLQSAHDNSLQGDTIYIYPGSWGSVFFNRKIILIGYGYFTSGDNSNVGLQNIIGSLSVNINLITGSDSSLLQGIDGLTVECNGGNVNAIKISRCHVGISYHQYTHNNWQLTQSYLSYFAYPGGYNYGGAIFSNLLISNCYLNSFELTSTTDGASTGVLNNNVFNNITDFHNCIFNIKNNIFIAGHTNDAYCMYQYNVATSAYPLTNTGNDTANKNVADISNVFVGYPNLGNYSYDDRYALKTSSVAITAGEGGTQTGIFGGNNPYHLSGIPPIPAFYKLTAPSTTTSSNPYTITFSVRSNN